jgi:hypothetical protein
MQNLRLMIDKTIRDAPDLRVVYTAAIAANSYHLSQKADGVVLFLHPTAQEFVTQVHENSARTRSADDGQPRRHLQAI